MSPGRCSPVSKTYFLKEGNVLFNDALKTFYLRLYLEGRKEGNVLFNNALNTFYLVIKCRTYGKGSFTFYLRLY